MKPGKHQHLKSRRSKALERLEEWLERKEENQRKQRREQPAEAPFYAVSFPLVALELGCE